MSKSIQIKADFTEIWIFKNITHKSCVSSAVDVSQNSQNVQIRCSKCPRFARTHLCRRSRHWFTALSVMFWSKLRHSSISRSFRWSTSWIWQRRPIPAECSKSQSTGLRSGLFSGQSSGWWSRVFQLTVAQPSHRHCGLVHCPAGRWRSHHTERMANGNWDLWQQFEKIENPVNGMRDSYKIWRQWQKYTSPCVSKISFKSVQVCSCCCKMFRGLTFLGQRRTRLTQT